MKAIIVMFDSLNRRHLPPYGARGVVAPQFERLARRSATFDNCYAGSMPCMPARRELHTGRYNFLHRSWGPLEPFDDSVPEMLKASGIYTHLVTDHQHYWEDGGATYHQRFSSFEFFRGQEGDPWKGHVADPQVPPTRNPWPRARQDWINRSYVDGERDFPQTQTFDAGLHFIETNAQEDDWLVQIETFDPHEPFFSDAKYQDLYDIDPEGPVYDWPPYNRVTESVQDEQLVRASYLALLSQCDASLGRVLDAMDRLALWEDTMLIVCTDHGFMLGEQGWWAKTIQPWYDEVIHTPLFIWDPRVGVAHERRESLVQTIDIGPTLLDFFGVQTTADMHGQPLGATVRDDEPVRSAALFGAHGAHVNVTDGRYVYMRACATSDNGPLSEYTLMPTHMRSRFSVAELAQAELSPGFTFTKGLRVLKVPAVALGNPADFGSLLFDLAEDPGQQHPLDDPLVELRMATLLVELLRRNDAPREQFERLGLPEVGPVTEDHLLVRRQWDAMMLARRPAARADAFRADSPIVSIPLARLLEDARTRPIIDRILPAVGAPIVAFMLGDQPLIAAAGSISSMTHEILEELERELSDALGLAASVGEETR